MNDILQGDCIDVLATLPEQSVHCCISSPPYWGLRDYKIPGRQWSDGWFGSHGLEPTLDLFIQHEVEVLRAIRRVLRDDGVVFWNLGDSYAQTNTSDRHYTQPTGNLGRPATKHPPQFGGQCTTGNGLKPLDLCGVPWRVALAAQADGWWLRSAIIWAKGESFNPDRSGCVMPEPVNGTRWERCRVKVGKQKIIDDGRYEEFERKGGAKQAGINPDWLAKYIDCPGCEKCSATHGFVLREGSWRATSAYEMVFMLTKTADYFADGEAGKENNSYNTHSKGNKLTPPVESSGIGHIDFARYTPEANLPSGRNLRNVFSIPGVDTDVWRINTEGQSFALCGNCYNWYPKGTGRLKKFTDDEGKKHPICGKCGKHDNWVGHFATFTPDLVKPMIAIATSERGCCKTCGAQFARVVKETQHDPQENYTGKAVKDYENAGVMNPSDAKRRILMAMAAESQTLGWLPTCSCYPPQPDLKSYDDLETTPAVVLDPFAGSCTTCLVAKRMGRHYIGIEINPAYIAMGERRLAEVGELL